jgi:hypothetical protein
VVAAEQTTVLAHTLALLVALVVVVHIQMALGALALLVKVLQAVKAPEVVLVRVAVVLVALV